MFGTTIPGTIPAPTYLLFTVRDAATVASSFNLPSPVSAFFQDRYGMEKGSADITAQVRFRLVPNGIVCANVAKNHFSFRKYECEDSEEDANRKHFFRSKQVSDPASRFVQ